MPVTPAAIAPSMQSAFKNRNLWRRRVRVFLAAIFMLTAQHVFAQVSVTISPTSVNLPIRGTQQFTATVSGASDTSVTWTIQEGASGGTITEAGSYAAPKFVGVFHVVATSNADITQSATATVALPGFVQTGLIYPGPCTSTLLPNGTILYTGGGTGPGIPETASAEVYDPVAADSAPTGSMVIPRCAETATLLPNGKVLFVGGQISGGSTASAELYDPISGTFSATGSMSVPRQGHSATLLPNGMVLIAGGGNCNSGCVYFATAELYDPSSGTFNSAGNLFTPYLDAAAILLNNGNVLIAGGTSDGINANSIAELYNPAAGIFTLTGTMVTPRENFAATILQNGNVLFAGGLVGETVTSAAEIYNVSTGIFTATGNLNIPRDAGHTATLLLNGQVLIAGGVTALTLTASAELYDPVTGTFGLAGSLGQARSGQLATLLANGTVLIAGGANGQELNSIEVYDPTTGVFTSHSVFMNAARSGHTTTRLSDGRLLLVGGQDANGNGLSSAEIYDPAAGKFVLTGSLTQARFGHTATLLPNGQILVVDGNDNPQALDVVTTTELYDPASGTFGPASSPNIARTNHAAVLLPNGKVLIVGGETAGGMPTTSAELYDPSAGTFAPAGDMTAPRYNPAATLLSDGRVLIADGIWDPNQFSTGVNHAPDEIYDPATEVFTPIGTPGLYSVTMPSPVDSVQWPNGEVLVDIGTILDPASLTFSALNPPSSATNSFKFALLPSNQIFIVGGGTQTYLMDENPLLLPPQNSPTYEPAGNLEYDRLNPTAELLPNGQVLIAGGSNVFGSFTGVTQVEFYVAPVAAPAPTISSVSPSPVAGFNSELLTVQGSDFTIGSMLWLDGEIIPSTVVSDTEITATFPANLLALPGNYTILVENAAGVFSALFTVTVDNPELSTSVPNGSSVLFGTSTVQTTTPQFVTIGNIGNEPLTLDLISISGTDTADFAFDTTKTTCPLMGGTIQSAGICVIYINFTPQAVGTSTATLTIVSETPNSPFVVTLSGSGIGPPVITSINPPSVVAAGAGFNLTVNGSGFEAGSTVNFNGASRTTALVNVTQLVATIMSTDIASAGWDQVTISNPGTGVGLSNAVALQAVSGYTLVTAGTALNYVPVTPCRLVDTRTTPDGPFAGPSISGGTSRVFTIPQNSTCNIPTTAAAYSLNVAVIPSGPLGYLTLWPTGQTQPVAATVSSIDGRVRSNAAIVPAGTSGAVSVFASNTTDLVMDINGYFTTATTALQFYPVTPCRVLDTRNASGPLGGPSITGNTSRTFPLPTGSCNLPSTAQAYSLNLAVVPQGPLGYLTAWPTGQTQPGTANLSSTTGTVTASAAIVPAGTSGSIDVYASNTTDLIIDVNGYFAPAGTGGLSLYTLPPCRVLDTRNPSNGAAGTGPAFSGELDENIQAGACGVPVGAQAYVTNATVVPAVPLGYLTLWSQGAEQPLAATLSALDQTVTSNLAIVPTTNGSISAFASNSTQLVIDLLAYFSLP